MRSSRGSTGPGSSPRDPDFQTKAARVLDLYARHWQGHPLGPDDYVISADEKSQLQALQRRHRGQPTARSICCGAVCVQLHIQPTTRQPAPYRLHEISALFCAPVLLRSRPHAQDVLNAGRPRRMRW